MLRIQKLERELGIQATDFSDWGIGITISINIFEYIITINNEKTIIVIV